MIYSLYFILGKHWGKPNALQIILSYRRNELRPDAEALLDQTVQGGSSLLLDVNALDQSQVQTLIDSLGIAALEPLQKTLHNHTGGNPLFMIETIKSVLESESVTLKLLSSSKVQILLQQRLDKLSQPALRLAWTAAVAQTDFSLELASHITQQSPFDLAEVLGELERRGIFTGQRFSHDLIFETALAGIAVPVKTYLHKQTAEFLEKQHAKPANIASHYLAASEQSKAFPFLQQAAEIAKRDFWLVDAAVFVEQMVDILEAQGKPNEAFDYLRKIREWLVNSNQYEKVESILERMLKLAHTETQRGESYFARAEYLTHQKGEFALAEGAAREGLTHTPPFKQRALLLGALGDALFFQDRLQESVTAQREAVKLHRELQSEGLATSLANLALPLQNLGEYREALELQQQAIELLRQTSRYDQLSVNLSNYAITLCELGRLRESLGPLREALELQQNMQGVDLRIGTTFLLIAQSHRDLCQFGDALVAVKKAIELSEQSSDYVFSYFLANLAQIYLLLGQSSLAKEWLDKAVQDLPDYPTICARVFRERGRWYVMQGQHDKAKQSFEKAKTYLEQSQHTLILDSIHLLEAVIVSPKESLELAKKVLTYAREGELKGGQALAALTRCAQAALRLKHYEKALEDSGEAIEMLKTYDPDTFYLGEIYLTHYQALKACKDKTAKDYLKQTLAWLMDIADNHVPSDYRESFLNKNNINKAILEAARLEGLEPKTLV
jgi:tetratricopeptide (TPR) repeat protein